MPIPAALFAKILCAIDFSDASLHALEYALALAQQQRSHLTLVHVVASEQTSDVIVLGPHGLGVTQLLFGSTAHQVVRQAQCPVLTIR